VVVQSAGSIGNGSGSTGLAACGVLLDEEGAAAAGGEDCGSVVAEAAVKETLLHGEAERRLGEQRETVDRLDLR
jgi:hypothetical protein